jgi:outer membrane protein assembly factor BamB
MIDPDDAGVVGEMTRVLGSRGWWRCVAVGVASVAIVAASGCTSASPTAGPDDAAVAGSSPATSPGWDSQGLGVHSDLSSTNDSIVYAGVQDGELLVVALDPTTGKERWRKPSQVGTRVAGVELQIDTDADSAYFLTSSGGSEAVSPAGYEPSRPVAEAALSLTAVKTATGETRWSVPVDGGADPSARACGPDLCLTVTHATGADELWRIDRASGAVLGKSHVSLPQGPGREAFISGTGPTDDDESQFIVASRGPVLIGQFSADGAHLDWAQPVTTVFGNAAVSPNGGWAGRPVDGGWVVWLGRAAAPSDPKPQPGDQLPRGAVAGISSDGTPRWVRTDRHACLFLDTTTPTLCDGQLHVISATTVEGRPSTIEGVDPHTGATTWTVPVNGTIDEFHPAGEVLRLDETSFLVTTPAGLVHLDVTTGPAPTSDRSAIGWCRPDGPVTDDIHVGSRTIKYARYLGYFPCRMGGTPADQPAKLPVPSFAGVSTDGWSAWVINGHVHAQPNPRS